MADDSNRFQLVGIPLSLERVIKDCRDLQDIVLNQKKITEGLLKEIEELKKKVG